MFLFNLGSGARAGGGLMPRIFNKKVTTSVLSDYQRKIEMALIAGNATEHTHRPALKELVEINNGML